MFKNKVIVNEPFTDRYTGEKYAVGDKLEGLTDERVNEMKSVKPNLVSVIAREEVKEEAKETKTTKAK